MVTKEIKLIEVEDVESELDPTMKRVEVEIYWRFEDAKTFDVPKEIELDDLQDYICYQQEDYFNFTNAWLSEFQVWSIRDEKNDDEWYI